jgi:hypothetical protein
MGRPWFGLSRSEVSGINLFVIAAVAAWLAGFGAAAAMLAIRRRREPGTWAIFGAILGPAALALLSAAPPGRCWRCAAPTEGWLTLCPWCGEDVREPVKALPVPERPVEEVRTHAQLTVIEGSAPRAPRLSRLARPTPQVDSRYASAPPSPVVQATVRNVPAEPAPTPSPVPRSVDSGSRERRIDRTSPTPLGEQARRMPAATAAASSASIQPAADPVRRLKASLGRSTQSLNAATARVPAPEIHLGPDTEPRSIVLASAIYVTGSRGLQAGSRYGIALHGDDLRILGPVDIDPSAVAIRHALRGMDATGLQGRLIITATDGRRDQLALVFMSVAGGSPEGVADAIVAAADHLETDPR